MASGYVISRPNRDTWPRGGKWDLCMVASNWELQADRNREWTILHEKDSEFSDYSPLDEYPQLFVAFAELGNRVWQAYEGEFLGGWLGLPEVPRWSNTRRVGCSGDEPQRVGCLLLGGRRCVGNRPRYDHSG